MGKTLSVDLRSRVIAAVEGGLSCHAAAAQFQIGSTSMKVHRCATGGKGGSGRKQSASAEAVATPSSTPSPTISDDHSPLR